MRDAARRSVREKDDRSYRNSRHQPYPKQKNDNSRKRKSHATTWSGCIYGKINTPNYCSSAQLGEDLYYAKRHDIAKIETMRRFGNPEGLDIMSRLDTLEGQVRTLQDEVVALRPHKKESFLLRKYILEGRDRNPGYESAKMNWSFQTKRHEIAHGGNVLLDCQVLAELRQKLSDTLDICLRNFERMYGIPYNMMCQLVSIASPAVIELYDIRANVRILDRWTIPPTDDMEELAAEIEKDCSKGIRCWEKWIQEGREGRAPDMETAATAARRLYDSGKC